MPLNSQKYRARLPEPTRLEHPSEITEPQDLVHKITLIRYIDDLIKTIRLRFESIEQEADTINTQGALLAVTHTTATTINATFGNRVYLVDTTAGVVTFNLPSATVAEGNVFYIKKEIGASTINVTPFGSETIDGSGGPLSMAGGVQQVLMIVSDGLNWYILNEHP